MKYTYGNHPAKSDVVYSVNSGQGKLRVMDIFDEFWDQWKMSDIVFIDFPYDDRMVRHYYEQIDKETDKTFNDLKNRAFEAIAYIHPKRVFVEIGFRFVDEITKSVRSAGYDCVVHEGYYFRNKKNRCYIVEGWLQGLSPVDVQISGIDQEDAIGNVCSLNFECITDFFNGLGTVSKKALTVGKQFRCSELNPLRLGKTIHMLRKCGASVVEEPI